MAVPEQSDSAMQVAILTPTGKDAQLTAAVLGEAKVGSLICPDIARVDTRFRRGLGSCLWPKRPWVMGD